MYVCVCVFVCLCVRACLCKGGGLTGIEKNEDHLSNEVLYIYMGSYG